MTMTLALPEGMAEELARRATIHEVPAEDMAVRLLAVLLGKPAPVRPQPRDEWEAQLMAIPKPYGVSLSNEAVSSDGIYD